VGLAIFGAERAADIKAPLDMAVLIAVGIKRLGVLRRLYF
jgi:hypothetical protein